MSTNAKHAQIMQDRESKVLEKLLFISSQSIDDDDASEDDLRTLMGQIHDAARSAIELITGS